MASTDPQVSPGSTEPSPPKVSVIVVSRNCADDLRNCLTALAASEPPELAEILVADKGSRDGSATLDSEFPNTKFLRMERDFGRTRAWNIATRTAVGEYLFLLPPAVRVRPDTIARLSAVLDGESNVGAVCPRIDRWWAFPDKAAFGAFLSTGSLPGAKTGPAGGAADPVLIEYPWNAPMLVRRGFVAAMNYFDQRFGEYWVDLDLCYRMRTGGKKIWMLPDVEVDGPANAESPAVESWEWADAALGAAAFLGKNQGPGAAFRTGTTLGVLGKLLTFQRLGFQSSVLAALLSGQKMDGHHSGS